jgi:N-acetylglucosamine kinase-like BadF-type ATPase
MDVIIGVDAGNSKTELLLASLEGEPVAYVRGPGANAHGLGPERFLAELGRLVAHSRLDGPAAHGAFFLCGVDIPSDIAELTAAVNETGWVREATVDNDSFALLRAGTDEADAVAVVCGAGINCVGRAADGRVARYPSLGWETGDWGGSVMLGRDILFHAARSEDGRGERTVLQEIVTEHFGLSVSDVGEAIHYGRLHDGRLGELAPKVVAAGAAGDRVARALVERLAEEVVLMAVRVLADLRLETADVVLGGGMLRDGRGFLYELVVDRLSRRTPGARAVVPVHPPVVGAALVALEAAGASPDAAERLRSAFMGRPAPEELPVEQ